MALRDDLIAAKKLIEHPENWMQGDYTNWYGCLCALGACRLALYGSVERKGRAHNGDENPLAFALKESLPAGDWRTVDEFNDHPDTTHADVMALFDRAIAAAGDA